MNSVTIIIPTFNEAVTLPVLLDDLALQQGIHSQIIVVDGGSEDHTLELARGRAVAVNNHRPHRAEQLNLGAERAAHDWMLFLHADSRLPDPYLLKNALDHLLSMGASTAGHFALAFTGPDSEHPGFRYLGAKSALNRPMTINGDQGFLVHRTLFNAVGGFDPHLPFLEDQRFAQQVWQYGDWTTLPGTLETSTRRFSAEGFGRRYLAMAVIMGTPEARAEDFFARFEAYRPSPDEQLDLGPILRAIREITLQHGPEEAHQLWDDVGRVVRLNAWQLALVLDVYLLQDTSAPLTSQFDRFVAPRLNAEWVNRLASGLAAGFFLVGVPSWWSARKLAHFSRR